MSGARYLPGVLVVVTGLFLAVQAWSAYGAARSEVIPPEVSVDPASDALQAARAADAGLAAATEPGRDPLHAKPVPRRSTPTRRAEPKPIRIVPPTLSMLLVDTVNPVIQIVVDGQRSGSLKVGDSFRGWTVDVIMSNAAMVSKDNKSYRISLN